MNVRFNSMFTFVSNLRAAIRTKQWNTPRVTARSEHDLSSAHQETAQRAIVELPVFLDPEAEKEFTRKGYVVRPFLEKREITAAQDLHDTLTPAIPMDLYQSISGNTNYRRQVSEGIRSLIQGRLKEFLPQYRISFCSFVTKRPNSSKGSLPIHIDPWFSDNRKHRSVHVWCPLIDVDQDNGCLKVIPGSHRLRNVPFALTMNPTPFDHLRVQLDREFATSLPMAAGDAVFYDGSLLHGSDENCSHQPRVALAALSRHETAKPCIFQWNKGEPTKFDILEISEEFLCSVKFMASVRNPYPHGVRYLESVHFQFSPWQSLELDELKRIQTEIELGQ